MNRYLEGQISNMIAIASTFVQGCELAAMGDDGKVDKDEQRQIAAIDAATKKYIKALRKIK